MDVSTMVMPLLELNSTMSFTILLAALVATLISLVFLSRRKRSHPLPPGPRALPAVGHLHLLGPLVHHSFHKLSSIYGPLIFLKFGKVPCVVASTPELAKELLKTHELNFSARKHTMAIDRMTYNSAFAFAPYGPYWKFVKKLSMTELLGPKTIKDFLPLRRKEYDRFLGFLNNKSNDVQSVNLSEELLKLANNVISQMMFSLRSSDTDGQADEARHLIREVTQMFGEFNLSDFIWFLKNIDLQGCRKRFEGVHQRYDALLEKVISEREELRMVKKMGKIDGDEFEVKDFLDLLLDVIDDEKSEMKITRLHIKALILDFFTAATDTTAISIEWALAELLNHPEILQKARNEVDQLIGNEKRLVQESDIPNLPYIQAILKETFRLHPPIPMISRKSVEECVVNGYKIPEGSLLFVNMWAIGRDARYWDSPAEFRPSRFLAQSGSTEEAHLRDIKGQHFQILPFGTGRRGCPGINLALQEVPTMIASLIHSFDWDVVGTNTSGDGKLVDMTERTGLTAPRDRDLVCVPRARFDLDSIL